MACSSDPAATLMVTIAGILILYCFILVLVWVVPEGVGPSGLGWLLLCVEVHELAEWQLVVVTPQGATGVDPEDGEAGVRRIPPSLSSRPSSPAIGRPPHTG